MHRGETITTTMSGFPIPISNIKSLYVVFRNRLNHTLLEKALSDCTLGDDETISFSLSQEESLKLTKGQIFRSVIIITDDGSRIESCPSPFECSQTVKDGVLT